MYTLNRQHRKKVTGEKRTQRGEGTCPRISQSKTEMRIKYSCPDNEFSALPTIPLCLSDAFANFQRP